MTYTCQRARVPAALGGGPPEPLKRGLCQEEKLGASGQPLGPSHPKEPGAPGRGWCDPQRRAFGSAGCSQGGAAGALGSQLSSSAWLPLQSGPGGPSFSVLAGH